MPNDKPVDGYGALANDLMAIRVQLDNAIQALEALQGSTAKVAAETEAAAEMEIEKLDP